jgi:hypothetical protein
MSAAAVVVAAAVEYVQFLDADSIADQCTDQALRAERVRAERRLMAAVADLQAETGA